VVAPNSLAESWELFIWVVLKQQACHFSQPLDFAWATPRQNQGVEKNDKGIAQRKMILGGRVGTTHPPKKIG